MVSCMCRPSTSLSLSPSNVSGIILLQYSLRSIIITPTDMRIFVEINVRFKTCFFYYSRLTTSLPADLVRHIVIVRNAWFATTVMGRRFSKPDFATNKNRFKAIRTRKKKRRKLLRSSISAFRNLGVTTPSRVPNLILSAANITLKFLKTQ